MALFNVFVVCLAVLQVAFSSVPATANKGFSFNVKTDPGYKNPPDLTFIAQISNDAKAEAGRAFNAYLGTGEAGVDPASTPRASAKVTAPQFVWSDSNGNVYFTDSHNHVIRKVAKNANEDVTIYAGAIDTSGFANDADPTVARFNRPRGISGDKDRIIVADTGNFRLRRIDLGTGAVTTFAGSATQGYSGDGGAATSAELWSPYGVWVNGKSGDVYFTELHKCTIRKVAASGIIETIVGTQGVPGYNGDGVGISPTTVLLDLPRAIYGDASGNVYWTEFNNNIVRYLSSVDSFVYTAAGGKLNSPNALTDLGDGGDATNAALNQPTGIWVDRVGNLYITESYTAVVRRVNADDKKISIFAGTLGARGPAGLNAGKNVLFHPRGIYGDQFLNFKLYLPDSDNHRIVTVSLPHPTISTFAGSATVWDGIAANGDGGDATSAALTAPADLWKDTNGNLFFTDYDRGNVRKVDSAGIITTYVGGANNDGNAVSAPTSVAGTSATFDKPWGIWGDNTYLYVSDSANKVVRRIAWSDKLVTIFAGGGAGTSGPATSVALGTPSGLWGSKADNTGLVYFADVEDCIVRSVTKPGGSLSNVVGVKGTCTFSTTYNVGSSGTWTLGYPRGLGGDKNGNLYVAEYNSPDGAGSVIRKWQLTGVAPPNKYQIVVGASDGAPDYTNAPNTYAIVGTKVNRPNSIWFDANDNMYFTEVGASAVRVVYSDSQLLVTLSGGNGNGFAGDGSVPYDTAVKFDRPFGIWGDSNSNLFVADQLNSRVRKITELNGAPVRRLLSNTTAAVEETPKFNLRRA